MHFFLRVLSINFSDDISFFAGAVGPLRIRALIGSFNLIQNNDNIQKCGLECFGNRLLPLNLISLYNSVYATNSLPTDLIWFEHLLFIPVNLESFVAVRENINPFSFPWLCRHQLTELWTCSLFALLKFVDYLSSDCAGFPEIYFMYSLTACTYSPTVISNFQNLLDITEQM